MPSLWSGFPWPIMLVLLQVTGASPDDGLPRVFQPHGWMPPVDACPESCEALFRKLEVDSTEEGKKTQRVEIQERGEPESGLSFMFEWASEILGQSCMYLQRAYGWQSCRVEWTEHKRTLIFEPWRATDDSAEGGTAPQCSCDTISSVSIEISSEDKHLLPCDDTCPWARRVGSPRPKEPVCVSSDRVPLGDHAGLLRCMDEAACAVTDDRLQMAVFRDPRATAASLFLRMEREHPESLEKAGLSEVDNFFLAVLPILCKWTSVRHRLFAEEIPAHSAVFWYDEVLDAPLKWHYKMIYYLGLTMPAAVVEWVVHVVTTEPPGAGFFATADEREQGTDDERLREGEGGHLASNRTYEDEVSAASRRAANHILRVWLPPALQEKLGVPEA